MSPILKFMVKKKNEENEELNFVHTMNDVMDLNKKKKINNNFYFMCCWSMNCLSNKPK